MEHRIMIMYALVIVLGIIWADDSRKNERTVITGDPFCGHQDWG